MSGLSSSPPRRPSCLVPDGMNAPANAVDVSDDATDSAQSPHPKDWRLQSIELDKSLGSQRPSEGSPEPHQGDATPTSPTSPVPSLLGSTRDATKDFVSPFPRDARTPRQSIVQFVEANDTVPPPAHTPQSKEFNPGRPRTATPPTSRLRRPLYVPFLSECPSSAPIEEATAAASDAFSTTFDTTVTQPTNLGDVEEVEMKDEADQNPLLKCIRPSPTEDSASVPFSTTFETNLPQATDPPGVVEQNPLMKRIRPPIVPRLKLPGSVPIKKKPSRWQDGAVDYSQRRPYPKATAPLGRNIVSTTHRQAPASTSPAPSATAKPDAQAKAKPYIPGGFGKPMSLPTPDLDGAPSSTPTTASSATSVDSPSTASIDSHDTPSNQPDEKAHKTNNKKFSQCHRCKCSRKPYPNGQLISDEELQYRMELLAMKTPEEKARENDEYMQRYFAERAKKKEAKAPSTPQKDPHPVVPPKPTAHPPSVVGDAHAVIRPPAPLPVGSFSAIVVVLASVLWMLSKME